MERMKALFQRINKNNDNQLDEAKKLICNIQKLVGIHNMFNDAKQTHSCCRKMVKSCLQDLNINNPHTNIHCFTFLSGSAVTIFCGTFVYLGTFSQGMYLINVIPDKVEVFKALNCLSATSVPLSKYIFMWTSRTRLEHIISLCREGMSRLTHETSAQAVFYKTLNKARLLSWLLIINQTLTHVLYLTVPIILTLLGDDKRYLPSTPGHCYGLTLTFETPIYEITYVLTIFATAFSAINQTGYITLFVTLMSHELGHFYAISYTLNDTYNYLSNDCYSRIQKDATVARNLKFCIKHQQFVIKYHERIKELYKFIFGAHFLMMTIVLVTTLQTLNSWDFRNTILTGVTGILPLFIYCFGGEMVISAETELSQCLYSSGWEMMRVSHARCVLIMLYKSQKPLQLTAAGIFVMNREMFGDIAQVVYKVYAVFN